MIVDVGYFVLRCKGADIEPINDLLSELSILIQNKSEKLLQDKAFKSNIEYLYNTYALHRIIYSMFIPKYKGDFYTSNEDIVQGFYYCNKIIAYIDSHYKHYKNVSKVIKEYQDIKNDLAEKYSWLMRYANFPDISKDIKGFTATVKGGEKVLALFKEAIIYIDSLYEDKARELKVFTRKEDAENVCDTDSLLNPLRKGDKIILGDLIKVKDILVSMYNTILRRGDIEVKFKDSPVVRFIEVVDKIILCQYYMMYYPHVKVENLLLLDLNDNRLWDTWRRIPKFIN